MRVISVASRKRCFEGAAPIQFRVVQWYAGVHSAFDLGLTFKTAPASFGHTYRIVTRPLAPWYQAPSLEPGPSSPSFYLVALEIKSGRGRPGLEATNLSARGLVN